MKKNKGRDGHKARASDEFRFNLDGASAVSVIEEGEHRKETLNEALAFHLSRYTGVDKSERPKEMLKKAAAFQNKCKADAAELVALYWGGRSGSSHSVCPAEFEQWLQSHEPLDRWFYIHLIEAAGKKALEIGYSQHKSAVAKSKNAEPRAWVLSEWTNRQDRGQSKASFARQYAPMVKKRFPKDSAAVTPETIARDWLPKGKA